MSARMNEFRRHHRRRFWTAGATLVAIAIFGVVFATSSGANLGGSSFEGSDGNLTVDTNGNLDWANVPGVSCGPGAPTTSGPGCIVDQPSGNTDNSFGQGTKEDDPNATIVTGTIPNSKDDLTRSYIASDFSGGNSFVYLSWQRLNTNGDANLDFELNQNVTPNWDGSTTGPLTIVRTAGDILITYDFSGGGTPTLGLLHWLTSSSVPTVPGFPTNTCFSANSFPCWGDQATLNGTDSEGKVDVTGIGPVIDPLNNNNSLGVNQFGEAAINLSAAGVFVPGTCEAFGSAWVKSRSSSSFTAEVKDFIAPGPIHVSNCPTVELKKHWPGTVGETTLKIGSSDGGSDVATKDLTGGNKGDGTTGANAVPANTYFFSEDSSGLGNYDTGFACTGAAASPTKINTYDYSLAVADGETVVCTFTNTRQQGSVELKKHWSGTAGETTLKIGSTDGASDVATKDLTGVNKGDGTTGSQTVDTGSYFFSEDSSGLASYTTGFACTGAAATPSKVNNSSYDYSLAVAKGETVVCTFTNTLRSSVELEKVWSGTVGETTLKIGSTNGASDVGIKDLTGGNKGDGTTGAHNVDPNTYFFSEDSSGLANYDTTFACTGAAASPSKVNNSSYNYSLAVAQSETVVCTFTNTRQQGSVELKKSWTGVVGETTLKIGSTDGASDVASKDLTGVNKGDGTTGAHTVDTGTYFFSEDSSGLANYDTTFACTGAAATAHKVNNSSYDYSLAVAKNETVVCTFTNTRQQASVELKKVWPGTVGETTLKIGSTDGASDVGTKDLTGANKGSGTTGAQTVNTGTYFFSEDSSGLANYDTSFACTGAAAGPTKINTYDYSLAVGKGETVVCTFTNTRQQGSVELKKSWTGAVGETTLKIGSTDGGSNVALKDLTGANKGNGTTGAHTVDTGTYFFSEDSSGLANFLTSFACTGAAAGPTQISTYDYSLAVAKGETVVCTFTNVAKGEIEIVKNTLGGDGTFSFTTSGGELPASFDIATSGLTGKHDFLVTPGGGYTVAEGSVPSGWSQTGLSCTSGGTVDASNHAQADITVAPGGFVKCTFTNTKLATLIVKKVVDNSNGGGTKGPGDFSIHVSTGGIDLKGSPAAGSSSGTTYSGLLPGTYKVSEDAVSGYSLTNISGCLADGSVVLDAGATVTCTLTNTSASPPPPPAPAPPAPKIDLAITKVGNPASQTIGTSAVTWTLTVTNNGPNGATGVNVADPLPAGTTFISVSTTQGTCTGGTLISCQLGSMAVGSSVTITLVTNPVTTGTLTNTTTVVGNEQETNTANNTATASVVVNPGVFKPPVVHYCTALAVSPKQLFVGRHAILTMRVSQHGKAQAGVRIRIAGSTLSIVTQPSNGQGIVKRAVLPKKAGIVTFKPLAQKGCSNPRIGVIGVFTPPVTG
jgi:uncharacterized repeat protein (TIGR01451 family)